MILRIEISIIRSMQMTRENVYFKYYSAGTVIGLQRGSSRLVELDSENGLHRYSSTITHRGTVFSQLAERFEGPRYRKELRRCYINRPQSGSSVDWLRGPQVEWHRQENYWYVILEI